MDELRQHTEEEQQLIEREYQALINDYLSSNHRQKVEKIESLSEEEKLLIENARKEANMATLGNPKNTIEVLQKYNFNFQKKFGQNFLINTGILEDIIAAAEITKDDFVLEIGPGIGTMTQYLCESAREVIA